MNVCVVAGEMLEVRTKKWAEEVMSHSHNI